MDNYVEENTVEIHSELLNQDFDEVDWEPQEIDDSDEESAIKYDY